MFDCSLTVITSDAFREPRGYTAGSKTTKTSILETPSGHLNYNYPQSSTISSCQSDMHSVAVVRPLEAQRELQAQEQTLSHIHTHLPSVCVYLYHPSLSKKLTKKVSSMLRMWARNLSTSPNANERSLLQQTALSFCVFI